tara:strand:+ start:1085 stop:1699 length:615 start_codon:yes stop_codon:yes gene_type:complete
MNSQIYELFEHLKNFKLNPNQFGILCTLHKSKNIKDYLEFNGIQFKDVKTLIRREFISRNDNDLKITLLGSRVLETINKPIENNEPQKETVAAEPLNLRKFKDADMEWLYYWRENYKKHRNGVGGSITDCISKMKKFIRNNPEATPDLITKATILYINSLDNLKYMRRADYFIYKQYNGSLLEEWLENVTDDTVNSNWDSNSIN